MQEAGLRNSDFLYLSPTNNKLTEKSLVFHVNDTLLTFKMKLLFRVDVAQ